MTSFFQERCRWGWCFHVIVQNHPRELLVKTLQLTWLDIYHQLFLDHVQVNTHICAFLLFYYSIDFDDFVCFDKTLCFVVKRGVLLLSSCNFC